VSSPNRLVLDRLWPMLLVLAALLGGAAAIEVWVSGRGNAPIAIAILEERPLDDEDEGAPDGTVTKGPPISRDHARARLAARRALYPEALALYEKLVAERASDAALLGEYGRCLVAAGQPEKGLPHLERADTLRPSADGALQLGLARARLGDLAGAERDLRRALAARPAHGATRIALGGLLRKRGATAEAIEVLTAAAAAGSNEERARALVALGSAHLAAGARPAAGSAFERAVEFAPARPEIRLGIARALLATGGRDDAARAHDVLVRAAQMAPDATAVLVALGRARERLGETAQARDDYDRALRLDPSHRLARRRLLRLALDARDFARARHEAERLVADGPDVPEHHFLAAIVADRDGRADDARAAYRHAIGIAPDGYPEAWLNLGVLEKEAGNAAGALAAYEKALALRPGYAAAWHNIAKLHASAGRAAEAESAWARALALDPRYAQAWLALGQLRSEARRYPEAIDAFRKALAAQPGYDAAELSLGVALARAGSRDEAIATYRNVVARSPRLVSGWFDLALALEDAKRIGEAREALRTALALAPDHLPSLRTLADLDLGEGRLEQARTGIEAILDLAPGDLRARVRRAELWAREGDRTRCIAEARRLFAEAPKDARVRNLSERCGRVAAR
jgi:tetratricopeptide (TPR) repeat protein